MSDRFGGPAQCHHLFCLSLKTKSQVLCFERTNISKKLTNKQTRATYATNRITGERYQKKKKKIHTKTKTRGSKLLLLFFFFLVSRIQIIQSSLFYTVFFFFSSSFLFFIFLSFSIHKRLTQFLDTHTHTYKVSFLDIFKKNYTNLSSTYFIFKVIIRFVGLMIFS